MPRRETLHWPSGKMGTWQQARAELTLILSDFFSSLMTVSLSSSFSPSPSASVISARSAAARRSTGGAGCSGSQGWSDSAEQGVGGRGLPGNVPSDLGPAGSCLNPPQPSSGRSAQCGGGVRASILLAMLDATQLGPLADRSYEHSRSPSPARPGLDPQHLPAAASTPSLFTGHTGPPQQSRGLETMHTAPPSVLPPPYQEGLQFHLSQPQPQETLPMPVPM